MYKDNGLLKIFFTILVVLTVVLDSLFGRLCYAQISDKVREHLIQEVQDLFGREAAEEIPVLAPKNFTIAEEFYQKAQQSYDEGKRMDVIEKFLQLARAQLEIAFETAKKVKEALEDLILIRNETIDLELKQYADNLYVSAENVFRKAVLLTEEGDITTAQKIAKQGESVYREAILITIDKGLIRKLEMKLEVSGAEIDPEKYKVVMKNLEQSKELFSEARRENITKTFVKLIQEIKSRINRALALIEGEEPFSPTEPEIPGKHTIEYTQVISIEPLSKGKPKPTWLRNPTKKSGEWSKKFSMKYSDTYQINAGEERDFDILLTNPSVIHLKLQFNSAKPMKIFAQLYPKGSSQPVWFTNGKILRDTHGLISERISVTSEMVSTAKEWKIRIRNDTNKSITAEMLIGLTDLTTNSKKSK